MATQANHELQSLVIEGTKCLNGQRDKLIRVGRLINNIIITITTIITATIVIIVLIITRGSNAHEMKSSSVSLVLLLMLLSLLVYNSSNYSNCVIVQLIWERLGTRCNRIKFYKHSALVRTPLKTEIDKRSMAVGLCPNRIDASECNLRRTQEQHASSLLLGLGYPSSHLFTP